jgi:hypothetical protein
MKKNKIPIPIILTGLSKIESIPERATNLDKRLEKFYDRKLVVSEVFYKSISTI